MMDERRQPPVPITYDVWKVQLRKDCEVQGKLAAFDGIGEYALRLLWAEGIHPTVAAIVGSARKANEE